MSVTVDHEPLAVRELGLTTVGEVLSHVQKENRLVVQMLIDGQEPQLSQISVLRQTNLAGHTLYIETSDPRQLAMDVLDGVGEQMGEAQRLKDAAADALQRNQMPKALEHLGGCIRIWQHAQESISKTAELLRIDIDALIVSGRPLKDLMADFSGQLRQIRAALEQRDFVSLSDILLYEMADTTGNWVAAIDAMKALVGAIR